MNKKKLSFDDRYSNPNQSPDYIKLQSECKRLKEENRLNLQDNQRLKKALLKNEKELKDAEAKMQYLLENLHITQQKLLVDKGESETKGIYDIPAKSKELLLLNRLLDTQEELLHYKYQGDEKLADNQKMLYGARNRVEQDLPYRLGKLTLQYLNAPKDLFKLPNILYKEYKSFLNERNNQGDLPPLEHYKDIEEAKKVKKHLSYRIGVPLASAITSPKSAVKLPYEISKQVYMFKLDKN